MSGRGHGDLPLRGPRGSGDRGRGRGGDRGHGTGYSRGSERGRSQPYETPSGMLTDPVPSPNTRVSQFEDEYVAKSAKRAPELGALARRPGYGGLGRPLILRANMFEMEFQPNIVFYSYRLKFNPSGKIKRKQQTFVLERMLRTYKPFNIQGTRVATDGATEIVTTKPLPEDRGLFTISMPNANNRDTGRQQRQRGRRGQRDKENYNGPWTITVEYKESQSVHRILSMLRDTNVGLIVSRDKKGNHIDGPDESSTVRMLNILLSAYPFNTPGIQIVGRGRNKVFRLDHEKQSIYIGGGIEAVRGYYSSVRLAAGRFLLNLNICHSAMYRPGSLLDLINSFTETYGQARDRLGPYLKMLKVRVLHLPHEENGAGEMGPPIRTIWSVAAPGDGPDEHPSRVKNVASSASNVQFWLESDAGTGRYITVADYFLQTHNRRLRAASTAPVVNVGNNKNPVYLPAEVCEVLPGQVYGGDQEPKLLQNMIKFSCRRPPQNYASIMKEGLEILGIDKETQKVGIRPSRQMITVPARILNAPNLVYAKKVTKVQSGSWNLQRTKFSQGAAIKAWSCVTIRRRGDPPPNVEFEMNLMFKKLREHGIALPPPQKPYPSVDLTSDRERNRVSLRDILTQAKSQGLELLIITLPNTEGATFDYIKFVGDLKLGVLTHCMILEKFQKRQGQDQYVSNNAMKINLKMGGCNQLLDTAGAKFIAQGNTMVVGLDVTHPPSSDLCEHVSIAGIVASVDGRMGQWPGEVRPQPAREEKIKHLNVMLESRMRLWAQHNKGPPANVLIYRDGVSDGQFNMVLKEELPLVRQAAVQLHEQFPEYKPNITIIVSGKRHHVRFYPTKAGDQDRTSNPPNGSIVDRGVTRPLYWDFYLQAQSPIQGSARPAHYIVIHDEIFTNPKISPGNPADIVQELTHNICYMMGRATRSISYATPAFLADRFCDRARKYHLARYHASSDPPFPVDKKDAQLRAAGEDPTRPYNPLHLSYDFPDSMVYI